MKSSVDVTQINNATEIEKFGNTLEIEETKIIFKEYFIQASYSASFVEEDDNG